MPIVIGLVGKPAAGKGTAVRLIQDLVRIHIGHHIQIASPRFSDVPREILDQRGLPQTRGNLQQLVQEMEEEGIVLGEGPGALSRAIKKRIEATVNAHIVIVDGVRWLTDAEMIRSFENNFLIYIKARAATRWRHVRKRKENTDDEGKTFQQFMKEDNVKNERFVEEIGASSDIVFENENTRKKLRDQVAIFVKEHLQTQLS